MSKLEVLSTGLIYRNKVAHVYSRHAYFPSVLQLDNGEMVATFCIGQAFESADLHAHVAHSTDQGATWTLTGPLYPGTPDRMTSDACRISHGENGEIVAFVTRHDRSREGEGLANPENMGFVEVELLLLRSSNGGRTWHGPETINPPLVGPSFELCSPIVPLRDGTWLLPTSTWRGWDGYCPNGMKMVAFRSTDRGGTWPDYLDVMADEQHHIIYWESKIVELEDGRLLGVAWTFNETEGKDLPIHYAVSGGIGKPFTSPRSTGLFGQTTALMQLEDGRLLSVYRRTDQPGLWANLSRLAGDEWVNEEQVPLWGQNANGLTAQNDNMVENFNVLKFGAPCLYRMQDGTIFVAFWAVEDAVANIRWLKLSYAG
ncbi:MAG: exo-alpha-sialidase [Paenibacillaceae bacterium]|nr:exo-alpha-sialidase [Paenibacillaceae bacterium]